MTFAARENYALLRTQHEYRRLALQGDLMKPMTRRCFAEAGIMPGMRVLDLGAGAGDVCLLLAEMVGPLGHVTGIDLDQGALEFAGGRTAAFDNITLVEGDFHEYVPVQLLMPSLAAMRCCIRSPLLPPWVRRLGTCVPAAGSLPELVRSRCRRNRTQRVARLIIETLRRSGAHIDMGPRLYRTFTEAGLPSPSLKMEMVMDGSPDSPLYQVIADSFVSMMPRAIAYGLAAEGEFDTDAIPAVFKATLSHLGYAASILPTVMAWCKTPARGK
jgi:SAM-dependent methyltransferase